MNLSKKHENFRNNHMSITSISQVKFHELSLERLKFKKTRHAKTCEGQKCYIFYQSISTISQNQHIV